MYGWLCVTMQGQEPIIMGSWQGAGCNAIHPFMCTLFTIAIPTFFRFLLIYPDSYMIVQLTQIAILCSVSFRTDAVIQNIIRTEFCEQTVMTVAHRLDTVMDSDKIMVGHSACIHQLVLCVHYLYIHNSHMCLQRSKLLCMICGTIYHNSSLLLWEKYIYIQYMYIAMAMCHASTYIIMPGLYIQGKLTQSLCINYDSTLI